MKKALSGLAAFWILVFAGLGIFISTASRDMPPPDDTDLQVIQPDVPADQNGYFCLAEAAGYAVEPQDCQVIGDYLAGKPVDEKMITGFLATNEQCLIRLRRGMEYPFCQSPARDPGEQSPLWSSWLTMARMLAVSSYRAREEGRTPEAVADMEILLCFGDQMQADAITMIQYLVGQAILQLGFEQILDLAREADTSPAILRQLAQALDSLRDPNSAMERVIRGEYHVEIWALNQIKAKTLQGQTGPPFVQKLKGCLVRRFWLQNRVLQFNRTRQQLAEFIRIMLQNVPKCRTDMTLPETTKWKPTVWDYLRPNLIGRTLISILKPSFISIFDTKCFTEGEKSGVKLVVACNRFQRDKGRWPDALGNLVPDYLPEVPRDPFDGQPFRYSAEKGMVWAVGTNLTDEGGSTRVPGSDKEYVASRNRNQAEDFVFELKPTTKAE